SPSAQTRAAIGLLSRSVGNHDPQRYLREGFRRARKAAPGCRWTTELSLAHERPEGNDRRVPPLWAHADGAHFSSAVLCTATAGRMQSPRCDAPAVGLPAHFGILRGSYVFRCLRSTPCRRSATVNVLLRGRLWAGLLSSRLAAVVFLLQRQQIAALPGGLIALLPF